MRVIDLREPAGANKNTNRFQHLRNQDTTEKEQILQRVREMVPFGGDVDDEEDLPLVGLQVHFLTVAILLRKENPKKNFNFG